MLICKAIDARESVQSRLMIYTSKCRIPHISHRDSHSVALEGSGPFPHAACDAISAMQGRRNRSTLLQKYLTAQLPPVHDKPTL